MMIEKSYVLVNRELLDGMTEELAIETGETITVKRRDRLYSPVLDEDREPTSEQRAAGWGEPYDVKVAETKGGYALVGRTPGPEERYSAIIVVSPASDRLRAAVAAMAEADPAYYNSFIELYTHEDGETDFDAPFAATASLEAAVSYMVAAYASQGVTVEPADTAVGKLNQVLTLLNNLHPDLGVEMIEGETNREVIEGLFGQVVIGWKIGSTGVG
jgi:hypothetical protein